MAQVIIIQTETIWLEKNSLKQNCTDNGGSKGKGESYPNHGTFYLVEGR